MACIVFRQMVGQLSDDAMNPLHTIVLSWCILLLQSLFQPCA
jgi:hypothetical protein